MGNKTRENQQLTGSFLGIPPRVLIRTYDNVTSSYPTILRTGDKDRSKKSNIIFDDTGTICFNAGVKSGSSGHDNLPGIFVSYPQVLPANSRYQSFPSGGIGFIRSGSRASLPYRKGYVTHTTDDYKISPFDETRSAITASQPGSYYKSRDFATGTVPEIYPGFDQHLKNKVQIVIDTSCHEDCDIFMCTGSGPAASYDSSTINTGLAYYNPVLKRFERHGHAMNGVLTGSNANPFRSTIEEQTGSFLVQAMKRLSGVRVRSGSEPGEHGRVFHSLDLSSTTGPATIFRNRYAGAQTGHAGWPFAAKFNATGSQHIKMSDYINHPFVVEKMLYQFSASFGTGDNSGKGQFGGNDEGIHHSTFHVVRQGNSSFNQNVNQVLEFYQGFSNPPTPTKFTASFAQTTSRDIIGSFQVLFAKAFSPNDFGDGKFAFRDLNLLNSGAYSYPFGTSADLRKQRSQNIMTGTYSILFEAKCPRIVPEIGILGAQANTGSVSSDNFAEEQACLSNGVLIPVKDPAVQQSTVGGGFSNQAGEGRYLSSGRALASSVVGQKLETFIDKFGQKGVVNVNIKYSNPDIGDDEIRNEKLLGFPREKTNPYILMPDDNLILSWANQNFSGSWEQTKDINLRIPKGQGKLILYGSLLRDGKPVLDETLNQNLTSDNIHESIHEVIVDQFDVEYRDDYYNTSRDMFITGTMTGLKSPRGSKGSFSAGTVQPSHRGAFQRFLRISDSKERYYDSVLPDRELYSRRCDGFLGAIVSPKQVNLPALAGGIKKTRSLAFNPTNFWAEKSNNRMAFPYDGNPKRVDGDTIAIILNQDNGGSPRTVLMKNNTQRDRLLFQIGRSKGDFFAFTSSPSGDQEYVTSTRKFNKGLVCTAPGNIGLPSLLDEAHYPVTGATGYRYGIKSITPEYNTAVFRNDRYGQFRDMLEQRQVSRFFVEGEPDRGAVTVSFTRVTSSMAMEKPSETNSSNLSPYATSSVPYIDGEYRNRSRLVGDTESVSVVFGIGS